MGAPCRSVVLRGGGAGVGPPESTILSHPCRVAPCTGRRLGVSTALPLLLCLFCLSLIAPASARDWHIERFDTQMSVAQDGVATVTERLDMVFEGEFHGIYRDIPIEYPGPHGSNYTLFLRVTGVTDGSGHKLKYDSSTQHGNRHLKIYIPDAVNTTRPVEIQYTVTNAVRWFDGHDELYWNVTGNVRAPTITSSTGGLKTARNQFRPSISAQRLWSFAAASEAATPTGVKSDKGSTSRLSPVVRSMARTTACSACRALLSATNPCSVS